MTDSHGIVLRFCCERLLDPRQVRLLQPQFEWPGDDGRRDVRVKGVLHLTLQTGDTVRDVRRCPFCGTDVEFDIVRRD